MISIKNSKSFIISCLCMASVGIAHAQNYVGKQVRVSIFSSTPVEDIKASSTQGSAVFLAQKGELVVHVQIKSLTFDKKLMQEHFNENYMESDKFPLAKFKGIIEPQIDWKKDGTYPVTAKGTLTVHGVDQPRTITGKITVKSGTITLNSSFDVACAAHKIEIPSIVFTKIAEIINVTIQGTLTPLTK